MKMNRSKLTYTAAVTLTVLLIVLLCQLISAFCICFLMKAGILSFDSEAPFLAMLLSLLPFTFIFGLIFALVAGVISVRPVRRLVETTQRVAEGDFTARFSLGGFEESNQLRESLNTMVEELGRTEALRDDFVSSIAHEFKTPVASISGFAKLLKRGGLTAEEEEEYLSIILSESERLSKLSGNVLLLSRLDNGTREPEVKPFCLSEQLRRVILLFEKELEEKQIELIPDIEECTIRGDEELLAEVWINLMGNAVKFTPEKGKIRVTVEMEEEHVIVTFRDSGPGMSEEALRHVFDKFYQEDRSRHKVGNGLGLSIARKIVILSGGTISAANGSPGAVFTVRLPDGGDE